MYAQKVEGKAWKEEKIDKAKIDKMSGKSMLRRVLRSEVLR